MSATLRSRAIPVLALDGDNLRGGVNRGLGFSAHDRSENLRRAAEIARLGTESNLCTVASFITPLESNRQMVAGILGQGNWSLVFVDAPLAVCQQRDGKGLYSRAKQGGVAEMTGVSSPFETPAHADLVIRTAEESAHSSSERLLNFALCRLSAART